MSDVGAAVRVRLAEVDVAVEERLAASGDEVAAIEVVPGDGGRRDEDLRLVREALDAGATPASLGVLFVTVVTNFAYEVDWKDHFCFWPRMHEHLRSRALDLRTHASRRAVAEAFRTFSQSRRGVSPVGELSRHFPLMAWPLVHAVMPWCAQRHVARALDHAAAEGLIPEDPSAPWPEGAVERLAASMRVPVFVLGVIENPAVLARVGRALLGAGEREDVPDWIRRLRRRVDGDAVTRALVAGVKDAQHERRRVASRAAAVPVSLALHRNRGDGGDLGLWTSIGPYGRHVVTSVDVISCARAGAIVRASVNGSVRTVGPLFNALSAPILVEAAWTSSSSQMVIEVTPIVGTFDGAEPPDALKRAHEGAGRSFRFPIVFVRDDDLRYSLRERGVVDGERVAVVVDASSALSDSFKASGFAPVGVRGAAHLSVLLGEACDRVADLLREAGVTVTPRRAALMPTIAAAIRKDGERFVFRTGRDLWLRLDGAPAGVALRAEIVRDSESAEVEVGDTDSGEILVRVPASRLGIGLHTVRVFARNASRALAAAEVSIESTLGDKPLGRWRVALQPGDASLEHLHAMQCWLEVDAIPGVTVEVELRDGTRGCSMTLERNDWGPLQTARALRELAARVFAGAATAPMRVDLLARALDEPESWATVASLGASEAPFRFDLGSEAPSVFAPDEQPALQRLEVTDVGIFSRVTDVPSLQQPGIYLAMLGQSCAALCVAEPSRRVPRLPKVATFQRSVARSVELLSTLRALDVAALWPKASRASCALLRRGAVRAVERTLVGSLCGVAWVREVEDLAAGEHDPEDLARAIARLTWAAPTRIRDLRDESDDPLGVLGELLKDIGEDANGWAARHLTLTFIQRGMTAQARDDAAIRWAWASVRRARVTRASVLLAPGMLHDWSGGEVPDDAA